MFTYLSIFTMLSAIRSLRMFKDKNLDGSMVETAHGAPLVTDPQAHLLRTSARR
jgi:hypothetical protein